MDAKDLRFDECLALMAFRRAMRRQGNGFLHPAGLEQPIARPLRTLSRHLASLSSRGVLVSPPEDRGASVVDRRYGLAQHLELDGSAFWNSIAARLNRALEHEQWLALSCYRECATNETMAYLQRQLGQQFGFVIGDEEDSWNWGQAWKAINVALIFFPVPHIQAICKYTARKLRKEFPDSEDPLRYVARHLGSKLEAYVHRALKGLWDFRDPMWDNCYRCSYLWEVLAEFVFRNSVGGFYGSGQFLSKVPNPAYPFIALPVIGRFPVTELAKSLSQLEPGSRHWAIGHFNQTMSFEPSLDYEDERRRLYEECGPGGHKFYWLLDTGDIGLDSFEESFEAAKSIADISNELFDVDFEGHAL